MNSAFMPLSLFKQASTSNLIFLLGRRLKRSQLSVKAVVNLPCYALSVKKGEILKMFCIECAIYLSIW